jgi:hypothetical protein
MRTLVSFIAAILVCSSTSGCTTIRKIIAPKPRWKIDHTAYTRASSKDVRIEISMAEHKARLLDSAGTPLVTSDISPGIPGKETPTGDFKITEKAAEKFSSLYGRYIHDQTGEVIIPPEGEYNGKHPAGATFHGAPIPYWLRLTEDGVGMHVGEFTRGVASSQGCIRCPEEPQRLIFEKVEIGTPVKIAAD